MPSPKKPWPQKPENLWSFIEKKTLWDKGQRDVNARDSYGWTPLHRLMYPRHGIGGDGEKFLAAARTLVAMGADAHATDNHGDPCFARLQAEAVLVFLPFLLEEGVDLDHVGQNGTLQTHLLTYTNQFNLVQTEEALVLLLEAGAGKTGTHAGMLFQNALAEAGRWGWKFPQVEQYLDIEKNRTLLDAQLPARKTSTSPGRL